MSGVVFASDLACKATGMTYDIDNCITAPDDGYCAMCGKPHDKGGLVDEMMLSNSFTLRLQLSVPDSAYRCLSCAKVLEGQDFLKKLGCGVVTSDGIYPCLSKKDRGYWLLNPPKPLIFLIFKSVNHNTLFGVQ